MMAYRTTTTWLTGVLIYILMLSCNGNETTAASPEKEVVADTVNKMPYNLAIPAGWTTERIDFPISFAPSISYTGTEDLRFAKEWGKNNSDEHWAYAFLWWLDGKVKVDTATLRTDLTAYYSGLVQQNVREQNIPAVKLVPTTVEVNAVAALPGDKSTFTATVHMLNYQVQEPMVLNCIIHVRQCDGSRHTAILFTISPKEKSHPVWGQLDAINNDFSCNN